MLRRLFGLVVLLVVVGVALYVWRGRPAGSPPLGTSAAELKSEARALGARARDELGAVGRKLDEAAGSAKATAAATPAEAPIATAGAERATVGAERATADERAAAAQRALRSNANVARFDLAVRQEGERLVLRGRVGTLAENAWPACSPVRGAGVPLDNLVEVRTGTHERSVPGGAGRAWRLALTLFGLAAVADAAEVGGIKLDERTSVGASALVLNGAGLRKRAFFRVYVAALYLTERRDSSQEGLALGGAKRVSITLMRDLTARELVDALEDGIRDNSSPAEQLAVDGRVEELAANMLAVRQGRKGDVLTVDWLPGTGTRVLLNGDVKGSAIPGEELYRALLKVWLGEHPTSAALKRSLLGQAQ